jgi:hypothetical protein
MKDRVMGHSFSKTHLSDFDEDSEEEDEDLGEDGD